MTEKEKQKQLIKKIVTENFSCSYCKELGMFDDCNSKKKSCEQILSDWFDEVMEQGKMTNVEMIKGTLRSKTMEIEKIEQNLKEVKRTERGWAGHFCCSKRCKFRRNTLLECGDVKIVVSTVGAMYQNGKIEEIGLNRHYETMAFHVNPKSGDYKDADFSREIIFESKGALKWHKKRYIDNEANDMHEAVVKEISDNLAKGWLYED